MAVVLSNALILAELVLELGVDVTSSCDPISTNVYVIENRDLVNIPTDVELTSMSYRLQHVHFPEQDFEYVTTGFPKDVMDNLCLRCLPKPDDKTNTIARGCKIEALASYKNAYVALRTTRRAFGTVAVAFKIPQKNGRNKTYRGDGDMTLNVRNAYSAILFQNLSDSVIYWEYNHQKHIAGMYKRSKQAEPKEVWEKTRTSVFRHRISCEVNHLGQAQFKRALLAYRSLQLERVTSPSKHNETSEMFEGMTEGDIYRAILALKSVEDVNEEPEPQEVMVYPQCATYDMKFAIPTFIMMAAILILLCITVYLKKKDSDSDKLQQLSEYLHVLNDSESIIPGCTTTQSVNSTPISSQELVLEEIPSSDNFYYNSPSVQQRRWFREADRIEVRWDSAENIAGLRVIPQGGSGNTLRRVVPKHLINPTRRNVLSYRHRSNEYE